MTANPVPMAPEEFFPHEKDIMLKLQFGIQMLIWFLFVYLYLILMQFSGKPNMWQSDPWMSFE